MSRILVEQLCVPLFADIYRLRSERHGYELLPAETTPILYDWIQRRATSEHDGQPTMPENLMHSVVEAASDYAQYVWLLEPTLEEVTTWVLARIASGKAAATSDRPTACDW